MAGKLIICPTPIGNLGDMTLRALEALREADVVCAEDTRVTGKLLVALGVEGKRLERLDENVVATRAAAIVARVQDGQTIAYCSDAGMPGVSDPGLRLVRAARETVPPVEVEVLPGPTAVATAYVASGTSATHFYFGGFFPRKDKERREVLEGLRGLDAALVFYESPKRIASALQAIERVMPAREVTVCRELTKAHEEVTRGHVTDVAADYAARELVKGEIVIVIDPPNEAECASDAQAAAQDAAARAVQLAAAGERPKTIAKTLQQEFNIPRNEAYDLALAQSR